MKIVGAFDILAFFEALIDLKFIFFQSPLSFSRQYIVALALPVDIKDRNVYMSNNLEANYALPTNSTDFTQGMINLCYLILFKFITSYISYFY